MSGFVYIWYDRKKKRFYIGSHWGSTDDGYVCSSSWMKSAFKNRPEDFKRRILSVVDESRGALLEKEQQWLSLIKESEMSPNANSPRYYNLTRKTGHWHGESEEKLKTTRERISARTKEAMARPDVRERYLKSIESVDRSWTDERRERQRATMTATMAKKFPDRVVRDEIGSTELKEKLSRLAKERWSDPEYKKRATANFRGRPPDHTGKKWWTDGECNVRAVECPDGWRPGRARRAK